MFDYSKIPHGHYDKVLDGKMGMRRFWHFHKFDSVLRALKENSFTKLIDLGCFAGSFIGRFIDDLNESCVGVDILDEQIKFANKHYSNKIKRFETIKDFSSLKKSHYQEYFDALTSIEVIEHLTRDQISELFDAISYIGKPGACIIITTPNYFSVWPILEFLLNRFSDVDYTEQHITKFNYFNFEKKLKEIYPNFSDEFRVVYKTTSHFLTPYISVFNYKFALWLSQKIKGTKWKLPFGSMILLKLEKIN